jgi:Spy/CpxP family protein refolding chaperone
MSFSTKLLTGALAVSAFAFAASAQDEPGKQRPGAPAGAPAEKRHDRMGPGMRGERLGHRGPGFELRGINLTDAQKEQIRQIHEANKPSQAQLDEMKCIREAARGGSLTDDQKARMKSFRDEAQAKMRSVHEQILAVLTAEQKAQLEQRRTEMRQRMEERRQKMQERRQQRELNRPKDTTKDTTKVT